MTASHEDIVQKLQHKVKSLTGQLVEAYDELNLMFDMAEMFSSLIDYEKVNQTILEEAMDFLEVDGGWMVSFDAETEQISSLTRVGVDLRMVSYFNVNFVLNVVLKGSLILSFLQYIVSFLNSPANLYVKNIEIFNRFG